MPNTKMTCFTIGHSNYTNGVFIKLLKMNDVRVVVDVRSVPYSRRNSQYNKENIKLFLEQQQEFVYVFMGDFLGARYSDPALFFFDNETVDFKKVRQTHGFNQGIDQLAAAIKKGPRVCLMCAEKDPFDCHRFVLVSYALVKAGVTVRHILENGDCITNDVLEDRLLSKYHIDYDSHTLFTPAKTKAQAIEEGYEKRNRDIGYRPAGKK